MAHTPIGEYKFKNLDKNDEKNADFTVVLAAGTRGSMQELLCKNYKINPRNYITLEEYAALFPEITYFVQHEFPNKKRLEWLTANCLTRFGID